MSGFDFDFETACAFLILAFFGWVIWRGGSANPVGTGQLQRQLTTIGAKVNGLEEKVKGCATVEAVDQLRGEFKEMEARLASSGEVIALEGKVNVIGERVGGIEKLADRTDATVTRIEDYLRGGNK